LAFVYNEIKNFLVLVLYQGYLSFIYYTWV
jgi:hypothetical protein